MKAASVSVKRNRRAPKARSGVNAEHSKIELKIDPMPGKKLFGKTRVAVCIPAYNEETSIAMVILKAQEFTDEVLVCDDGSVDMTREIAQNMGAEVIVNEKNLGKGAALQHLFKRVKQLDCDIIVTLDADGQHDASQIQRLVQPIINKEADVVIGSRYVDGSWMDAPLYRRGGLAIINWIYKMKFNGMIADTQSGFRAYSKKALDVIINSECRGYEVELEHLNMAIKEGLQIKEVPVDIHYRGLGRVSKRNPILHGADLISYALKTTIGD